MSAENAPRIRPHHCGINVIDFEGSIKWYGEMLGFALDKRLRIPQMPGEIAFLRNGNYYIELFELPGGKPPADPDKDLRNPGLRHVAFAVDDVRGTVAALRQRGVEVIFERDMGGKPMAFIRDNSGNRVELVSLDAP